MQYVLLFLTVIKCIAPPTLHHTMYNISEFLLVYAKIKCTRAAPLYIFFLAGTSKKKCYTLYIVKFTIFCLNKGLRVYLDLYAPDFPKSTPKNIFHPSTLLVKTPHFGALETTPIMQ